MRNEFHFDAQTSEFELSSKHDEKSLSQNIFRDIW